MFRRTSAHAYFEDQFVLRKTLPGFPGYVAEWEALSSDPGLDRYQSKVERFGDHPRQTLEIFKADPAKVGRGLSSDSSGPPNSRFGCASTWLRS